MIVTSPQELVAAIPARSRLMGLDLGEKTIGIAAADPGHRIATPVTTIRRKKFREDVQQLLKLIDERGVGGLVVGLPLNMDGSEGPRCQSVRQFANNLFKHRDMPVLFWDERLSTVAVTRDMLTADVSRAKRARIVDESAAAFILQGALDGLQR